MREEYPINLPEALTEDDDLADSVYTKIEDVAKLELFREDGCGEWIAETKIPNLYFTSYCPLSCSNYDDYSLIATTPEADKIAKKLANKLNEILTSSENMPEDIEKAIEEILVKK